MEIAVRKTRKDGEDAVRRRLRSVSGRRSWYLGTLRNVLASWIELMKAGAVAGDTVVIGDPDGGTFLGLDPDLTVPSCAAIGP